MHEFSLSALFFLHSLKICMFRSTGHSKLNLVVGVSWTGDLSRVSKIGSSRPSEISGNKAGKIIDEWYCW